MGKIDLGVNLAERCAAYIKASGRSLLATRPAGKINTEGLRYAPKLEGDVATFTTKEIKLDEEIFSFLPWRRGKNILPPVGKVPEYNTEAKEATELFVKKGWIEDPLPNGFRIGFGPYRFNSNGQLGIYRNMRVGKTGSEMLYYNEKSHDLDIMTKRLQNIYAETPNITEEQKAEILYKFVNGCYDRSKANWIEKFANDFIPIENTAASGAGVCRHKSFLAKALGDRLGLHVAMARGCYITHPEVEIGESHIWNEIKIKDKWFLMDVEQERFIDLARFPEFAKLYEYAPQRL